ncbi:hypothetical protein H257_05818 [Aphanomyces astaci]|uniref:Uncharacterized protein n=1 Tax=Aphanomyces astaci TaxID=112090 RepID=W4GNH2_APHAT|nr:hypothetical protein H257_05818 [Aphanomyces astaci]ETV81255.1 hypothetical protein H257_05818 [Aphanomyces astaci]|eukprot:XP_009829113.1 hypothetical protein H257_05818 [Aphanomyces astaci]
MRRESARLGLLHSTFGVSVATIALCVCEKHLLRGYIGAGVPTKLTASVHTGVLDYHVYRDLIVRKVLPALKSSWRWPSGVETGTVFLQQDNARPHIAPEDPAFVSAALL